MIIPSFVEDFYIAYKNNKIHQPGLLGEHDYIHMYVYISIYRFFNLFCDVKSSRAYFTINKHMRQPKKEEEKTFYLFYFFTKTINQLFTYKNVI
jgi:hypothetical protein